jgi:hypothetical protein
LSSPAACLLFCFPWNDCRNKLRGCYPKWFCEKLHSWRAAVSNKMLLRNKYGLKKPRDFTMFEGHKYPLVTSKFEIIWVSSCCHSLVKLNVLYLCFLKSQPVDQTQGTDMSFIVQMKCTLFMFFLISTPLVINSKYWYQVFSISQIILLFQVHLTFI